MKSILTTLTVVMLVQPASALARGPVLIPPGDSASSQYVESVPTDRGGAVPGSGAQPNALTPGQSHRLAALGPDGRRLVAVVQATSPPPAGGASVTSVNSSHGSGNATRGAGTGRPGASGSGGPSGSGASGGSSRSAGSLSAAGAPSTAGLVVSAATGAGGGGLGIFLPLLLLASALAIILHAIRRWRARAS